MAEHLADLGWEKRKIQTLADLKREIEKQIKGLPNDDNLHGQVLGLNYALNVINSFEAGVREMQGNPPPPKIKEYTKTDAYANGYFAALRAILGDRDG